MIAPTLMKLTTALSRAALLAAMLAAPGAATAQAIDSPGFSSVQDKTGCTMVLTRRDAERCLGAVRPQRPLPTLDPAHVYTLLDLIDLAEEANPDGRIAWATAKREMEHAGIERAEYLPLLTFVMQGSDVRAIVPFPKPLAPIGYVTVQQPIAAAQFELEYKLLDFARGAKVDSSRALELASTLRLGRVHQTIAATTAAEFYKEQQADGQLIAAKTILATAETLLENARAQYDQGRATLPDVQNAEAGAAESRFDLATATGEVQKAKLALTETVGVEPTAEIQLEAQRTDAPEALDQPVEELIQTAWRSRPDLLAHVQEVRAAKDATRGARAGYKPTIGFSATGGQTATWPTADYGQLGYANVSTWSVQAKLRWEVFNGARRHQVQAAQAGEVSAAEEQRAARDGVTRQVWDAYVDYQTAIEQVRSSESFLAAATTSYDSSLDAYKYGVRSLVDVVQAERQLAQARLVSVRSRSHFQQSAVALGYATGELLRNDITAPTSTGVHP